MDTVQLCIFLLSLMGTVVWLFELPQSSITSWADLYKAFLEMYFLRSKKIKLKGQINNFEQLPSDSISTMQERITICLRSIPDHKIVDDTLVEIVYCALDENSQACTDTIMGGMFWINLFAKIVEQMEQVVKTNHAWGHQKRASMRSSCVVNVCLEKAKINKEIMQ